MGHAMARHTIYAHRMREALRAGACHGTAHNLCSSHARGTPSWGMPCHGTQSMLIACARHCELALASTRIASPLPIFGKYDTRPFPCGQVGVTPARFSKWYLEFISQCDQRRSDEYMATKGLSAAQHEAYLERRTLELRNRQYPLLRGL